MKNIKTVIIILFVLFSLSTAAAQEKATSDRDKDEKKAADMYREAKQSVSRKDWSKAMKQLQTIVETYSDTKLTDDSLYWLGYSMNRLSQTLENLDKILDTQKEALSRLETLMRRYPSSKWIDYAKLLRVDIADNLVKRGFKQYKYILNGASKDPDIEVKLAALHALVQMDKEKAFPILEKIIRTNKNQELKEKAIFILSQINDSRVIPLLVEVALKDTNKKIREKAIFLLGQIRGTESLLVKIYKNINDVKLKEKVIFSIAQGGKKVIKLLIQLYREEESLHLKRKIIFWLGQSRSEEAKKFIEKILME
jgi:outer membrane protein assembly factor BamD (BamD/ComL family)